MGFFVTLVVVLVAGFYAVVSRILAHKERMAAIEAKRPRVVLQLPEAPREADELSEKILEACRQRGIDIDVEPR
ncbi:MAG TPA: hypothetical protein PKW35_16730 [Nannocystaceae bacterium]|nr:hypothetical protein [Nannocystaceae bacterium]